MRQPGKRSRITLCAPRAGLLACAAALLVAGAGVASAAASHPAGRAAGPALTASRARIDVLIRKAMSRYDLRAVIVQATVAGRPVITKAYGESMTGVPATTSMHFRNGAVAISYMSTLLLRLADEHKVSLDDPVSRWLPGLRDARMVTLRMLAAMSSGYFDYEQNPRLTDELYANPFATITTSDQLRLAFSRRQLYKPGTNWSYAHTNYVILGLILARITHQPLAVALRRYVLGPLGLRNTTNSVTAAIPAPVLHAYSAERRAFLGIKRSIPFLEDSTYWNPSWTLARGAVETTDIADMTRTAIGIGSGSLLSRRSYAEQINPRIGFGHPQRGCPTCRKLNHVFGYGLGVVRNGSWILQNPLFGGYGAVEAYLPGKKISIAVATTFGARSYDAAGNISNYASTLYSEIGAVLAPGDPPPAR
jgi:CubicO group peptidase (beta-lactamase class C family)